MFGRGAGARPTSSAVLSDITACLYDYKYEYKKLRHSSTLPQFSDDIAFRIYVRYSDPVDLGLLHFEEVYENYSSKGYNYIVGRVTLKSLHAARESLNSRKVFLAAYPSD